MRGYMELVTNIEGLFGGSIDEGMMSCYGTL